MKFLILSITSIFRLFHEWQTAFDQSNLPEFTILISGKATLRARGK